MNEENITKLPKWAQEHIRVLEVRLREANLSIASLESDETADTKSNITYQHGMDKPRALRMGTQVMFSVGPHEDDKIQVGFGNRGELQVYAGAAGLIIRPKANNMITLEQGP